MALNFAKLDKFEGVDFRIWKKKMHFLLSSMSVVYVLTTPIPEDGGDDATVEQIMKRAKWDNDDYVCRGLILNGMFDSLFDIYHNVESSKELWDSLEAKYMAEDASSKKFLVSNFTNYKMTDSRPVLEQYNKLLGILGRFTQHKMNMYESIQVSCIIDKLPPSWKDFKHTLKHLKEELTLVELGSHLRIEESLGMQDSDKPKGNNVAGPLVFNMVEHNKSSKYNDNKGKRKHHDNTKADPNKKSKVIYWKCGKHGHLKKDCKGGKVGNKANGSGTNGSVDGSTNSLKGQNMFNKSFQVYYITYVSEAYFVQDDDVTWLNIVNDNIASAFMSTSKLNDSILWHARLGHVHFKRMQDMSKDGLIPAFNMDTEKCKTCMLNKITKKLFQNIKRETEVLELIHSDLCNLLATPSLGNKKYFVTFIDDASRAVVRLPDLKLKTLGERGIECIFVGYAEHFKACRFYVIEPNDSVSINSIIKSRDAIFDENRISSVPRPSLKIPNGPNDIVVQLVLKRSHEVVVRTKDEVSDQHSYCFNVEDDPKTFDEAMKSQDVAFWKEAINDEMDSIMGNNTWVLADLPPGIDYFDTYAPVARISTIRLLIAMASIHNLIIHQMDVKIAFLNGDLDEEQAPKQWHQKFDEVVLSNGYLLNQVDKYVDLTKEFLSSRFSIKDMGEVDVILGIRIKHESNGIAIFSSYILRSVMRINNGQVVSQLEYSRVIGCLMYAMTCTRPDIAFAVGKLSRLTYTGYPSVLEGYTDASWISNTEDNSFISGWVFLLGGGAISWASKKQTCITGSTIESEFVALAAAGKEAECAATLAKAYSQMYNGKSRHLGVRHSMIRELITNEVISIEFVRSQQNLVDHLTKGLARDLVIKSAEGMRLMSN
ncbi:zinc finger, CCHC-type containing protein [Tanacetum coccineum]